MTDIFREVDEDLRREQLKNVWNKYGIYFLALAALLVLGTAGWRGYEYFEAQKAASNGDKFLSAVQLLDDGKMSDAALAFETVGKNASGRYPGLALMAAAGAKAASGDVAGAAAAFDQAAASSSTPDDLKPVAKLRAAYLLLDTASQDEIKRRVAEFDKPDNAYHGLAWEILGLAAWKAGDMAEAGRRFDALITDPTAPDGAKRRAGLMRQLVNARSMPDGAEAPVPAAPAPAPAAPAQAPAAAPAQPPAASAATPPAPAQEAPAAPAAPGAAPAAPAAAPPPAATDTAAPSTDTPAAGGATQ
jgi:hypothetical protein